MRPLGYRVVSLAAIAASMACVGCAAWTLTGGGATWEIDETTGALQSGATADGFRALGACCDRYAVVYPKRTVPGDEKADRVTKADAGALPKQLTLACTNEPLGLSVTKTYRIDPENGWLLKETAIVAPRLEEAFVHFVSNVHLRSAMWTGGILHHPISHSGSDPLVPTADVAGPVRFVEADGTGLMSLTHPKRNLTVGHVRLRSNGQAVFWDYIATFGGGLVRDPKTGELVRYEVAGVDSGTVARPTEWHMSAMHGPVGAGATKPVSVELGYALAPGDFYDFQAAYVQRADVFDLLNYEAATVPAWVHDVLVTDWEDYQVTPEKSDTIEGEMWGALLRKMWFGVALVVNFGFYEGTYEYAANDEQWAEEFSTMPGDGFKRGVVNIGKKIEDHVVREEGANVVTRNRWKPSEHRAANRRIREASGSNPRLKIGPYTHIGHTGFDRESKLIREHPDIVLRKPDGEPYRHAMDYNMDWDSPVGMRVQGARPEVQRFWQQRLADQFEFFDLDFSYIDGFCRGNIVIDWGQHTATQNEDMYPMWRGFIDACRRHDAALFHNYPYPLFNDIGYSELPWYSVYRMDWRAYSIRHSVQQVYNRGGRPIMLVGHFEDLPEQPMQRDSAWVRLHSALLLNHRIGINNFGHMTPRRQLTYCLQALPWLQAIFELRLREYVNPHITPRWWAEETDLETHGYRLGKGTGVIVAMNHGAQPDYELVTIETTALGLKLGRPTWIWRAQLPHPQQVDYSDVTATSPIRRLANQRLVAYDAALSEQFAYREKWTANVPVLLVMTQTPALVESVDGRGCQLWLPEVYDIDVAGVADSDGRVDLKVRNRHDVATLLVPLRDGQSGAGVQMRRLDAMHEAGVLPAFENVKSEAVERDGGRFVRFSVPRGTQEIIVR